MTEQKPKIIFMTLYRHHCRFFSHLVSEGYAYHGLIMGVYRLLWPLWVRERPTAKELAIITRYSTLRKRLAWPILRSAPIWAIVRAFQQFVAGVIFSNCYYFLRDRDIQGIVVWNGQNLPLAAAVSAARRLDRKVVYFENGPLPDTTMIDRAGINFENSFPREQDLFRQVKVDTEKLSELLRTSLVPRAPRSGKKIGAPSELPELPEKFYFLPFQTYNDTQILLFSSWISNMNMFTRQVVTALEHIPDAPTLVVKEHPSCRKSYPNLRQELGQKVIFADGWSTMKLIQKSQGVITINSSVGIEALLLERPVLTLGQAFFNIEGLVLHTEDPEQLQQALAQLKDFRPEKQLREGFLYYLRYQYLLGGTLRNPDPKKLIAMGERVSKLMMSLN